MGNIEKIESAPGHMRGFGSAYEYNAAKADEAQASESYYAAQFLMGCKRLDANGLAPWAGLVTDWANCKRPVPAGQNMPKRVPTMAEVIEECVFETPGGVEFSAFAQLALNATRSTDPALASQANALMVEVAQTFSRFHGITEVPEVIPGTLSGLSGLSVRKGGAQ